MSTQHTPGPWFTTRPHQTIYVEARLRGTTIQEVAACGPCETASQQEGNARLIASAPRLLASLQRLSDQCARMRLPGQPKSAAEIEALEALAEATGNEVQS